VPEYQHAEAFCLMKYRSDDGTEEELIWNSRDGVTPFTVTLRSGKTATHVDWQSDRRIPDYEPPAGSRTFVDLTPERAREIAERIVDQYLSNPELGDDLRQQLGTRDQAIAELTAGYLRPGAPDIVEVAQDSAEEASRG
jgi:hypothetical protein